MRGRSDKPKFSQQSMSSDDAGIMAVVAQQMQTSWEKKRKEKETKYFQDAKVALDKCSANRNNEFIDAVTELTEIYEKFVLDYAEVEDDIRKIWVQMLKEQQKVMVLAGQRHQRMVEAEKARERGQVQGMAIAKKAMEDYNQLVASLRRSE